MLNRTVRIGTRTSPLALKQVEEVVALLRSSDVGAPFMAPVDNGFDKSNPYMRFEIVGIDTYGDKDKITPISDIEGSDFFTREIEEALLKDEIDFAVHSAKDLPDKIPDGLYIAAITESIDPYDALVSRDNLKIDELPFGARIGASSQRRKMQLKTYRDDFQIVDIRGNIQERLAMLDGHCEPLTRSVKGEAISLGIAQPVPSPSLRLLRSLSLARNDGRGISFGTPRNDGKLDAIIVAACALVRLGLEDRIAQRIPFDILTPHPLQGALAIEVRQGDKEIIDFIEEIK